MPTVYPAVPFMRGVSPVLDNSAATPMSRRMSSFTLQSTKVRTMNRQAEIEGKLGEGLSPLHLQVDDESHLHNVPVGAQSHFRVTAVSEVFRDKPLVARHRLVNGLLAEEFASGLHALALHTWTPEEWFDKGGRVPESPPCLGGSKAG